jgi:hypothetical protein
MRMLSDHPVEACAVAQDAELTISNFRQLAEARARICTLARISASEASHNVCSNVCNFRFFLPTEYPRLILRAC